MLYFVDTEGVEGEITDSLQVDYTGHWQRDIEDFTMSLESNYDGNFDVSTHRLLELPDVAPIVEVQRYPP